MPMMGSMNDQAKTLGAEIRQHRVASGLSQEALAEAIGCDQGHISRLETGKYLPSLLDAKKIANALGIDIALLLEVA